MPEDLPREHDIVFIEIYTIARVVNGFSSVLKKEGQEPQTLRIANKGGYFTRKWLGIFKIFRRKPLSSLLKIIYHMGHLTKVLTYRHFFRNNLRP